MNDQVMKGALMGLAAGGLASAVIAMNKMAFQTLWLMNCITTEIVWDMVLMSVNK